jgi:hypothetical protein
MTSVMANQTVERTGLLRCRFELLAFWGREYGLRNIVS